jgi:hypothetical protein
LRRTSFYLVLVCLIATTDSCRVSVKAPPLVEGHLLQRIDREVRAYHNNTGAWPTRGTDLPADAVERLRPFRQDFCLEYVRFYRSPDGHVVTEWRPKGKHGEWMWISIQGNTIATGQGAYLSN